MSTLSQRSFAAGELTPAMYARVDTARYANGARTLRNCYVLRSGGTANRAGTTHMGEVKDSTKRVRLIDFVFSDEQTYVLEFGNLYMRVIKQGDYVKEAAQNITAITNANPCVVTYAGADNYANGDVVYVSGIVGAIGTYLNGREFKVANVNAGANTFELDYMDGSNVNSTSMGAYTSGGTVEEIYTIATSYVEADLPMLQYAQSADVVTITHGSYPITELSRTGDASWAFATTDLAPIVQAPVINTTATTGPTRTGGVDYYVTSIGADSGEESEAILVTSNVATPAPGTPATLSMSQPATGPRAASYNIYRDDNSGAYYIGTVGDAGTLFIKFIDTGVALDLSSPQPVSANIYNATDEYPSVVGIVQQRRAFANTNTDTEEVRLSRAGSYRNFITSSPITDDGPIKFSMAGLKVNAVRHILELGSGPVVFTQSSVQTLQGNGGILTPSAINPKTSARNGASTLRPLPIDETALYVQARGSKVRDLNFDYQVDGYRGNDLTITASHLVDGYEIVDWAYQENPHSVVWAVRDDGVLLSLTYIREQQILGWARHDFDDGLVENVCVVPEGTEDAVYLVVKRTVDGRSVRYVERMNQRRVDARNEMVFMDATLGYDGRNTGSTTMTLSGGTTWAYDETLTLTASAAFFASAYIGDEIHITSADGTEVIRCEITAYTSTTVVSVRPNRTVPVAMRSTALLVWSRAVDQLTGIWHLEGKAVSILGDGYVIASPYNPAYTSQTVTNGSLTLDKCYSVIYVGLPYVSDVETLDVDTAEGETAADKRINVTRVTVHLEKSVGVFVGRQAPTGTDLLEGLNELKIRSDEGYDEPTDFVTGKSEINIESNWNSNGRIFIRQVDPLPMSVLAVCPAGFFPFGK